MPEPLTTYINTWRGNFGYIYSDGSSVHNYMNDAATQCTALGFPGLALCFSNMAVAMDNMSQHFSWGTPNLNTTMYAAMHWIDLNWPTGGTVNMGAILSAMLLATPTELTQFIGIEQAYMAAIWNAPYNGEYYAALARGFRKWP